MFGHHDDDQPADEHQENTTVAEVQPTSAPPTDDIPASSFNDDPGPSPSPEPAPADNAAPAPPKDWQHAAPPQGADNKATVNDLISPAGGFPKRPTYQYPQGTPPPSNPEPAATSADPELIDIRDHALEELEPLLDTLDLPPEDKFRLIMMILQHKDDESLVKKAYEAAHAIEDDDVRGRALYDIVNEVNYFTQPPDTGQES